MEKILVNQFTCKFKTIHARSLLVATSVTFILTACGGGTGTAQYSIDSAGNLTSANVVNTNPNGTVTTTVASSSGGTTGTSTTTTTTPTTTTPTTTTPTTTTPTTTTPVTTTPMPFGQAAGTYKLAFQDEFNSLNTAVWNDTIWYEASNPTKNYAVSNGSLKIWPQRDASGKFFNRTIDTDGKYYQTYGFFEIEAKLPVGKGTWPAFWLFNHIGTRRPEIDVMEAYAGGGPNSGWSDANLHPTAYAPTVWLDASRLAGTKTILTSDLSAAFHKYALKWEPNKQTFYFDGREVYTLNVTMPDPMYIMLDLWYGSASGTPDNTTPTGIGNSYEVNYVRAWSLS
ncbi:SKN1 Beta-glucanase/Beta-glucan synthetase [Oxalobacteraceae bacterium]